MKETSLENPEILVKDKRILELDKIVTEVKESEEWEDTQMTIYDMGIEKGLSNGIKALIEICNEVSFTKEETIQKLMEKFNLDEATATKHYQNFNK